MKNLHGFIYVLIPMVIMLSFRGAYVGINVLTEKLNDMVMDNDAK